MSIEKMELDGIHFTIELDDDSGDCRRIGGGRGYGGRLKHNSGVSATASGSAGMSASATASESVKKMEIEEEIAKKLSADPLIFRDPYEIGQILEEHIHDIISSTLNEESGDHVITGYRERDIRNLYGDECAGIDHIFDIDDDIRIFIQDKFEDKSPTLRDVNHFITCVETVKIKSDRKYTLALFASKIAPTTNCAKAFSARCGYEFIINSVSIFELALDVRARIVHFIHHKTSITDNLFTGDIENTVELRGKLLADMRERQRQREFELKSLELEIADFKIQMITQLKSFKTLRDILHDISHNSSDQKSIIEISSPPPPNELIHQEEMELISVNAAIMSSDLRPAYDILMSYVIDSAKAYHNGGIRAREMTNLLNELGAKLTKINVLLGRKRYKIAFFKVPTEFEIQRATTYGWGGNRRHTIHTQRDFDRVRALPRIRKSEQILINNSNEMNLSISTTPNTTSHLIRIFKHSSIISDDNNNVNDSEKIDNVKDV